MEDSWKADVWGAFSAFATGYAAGLAGQAGEDLAADVAQHLPATPSGRAAASGIHGALAAHQGAKLAEEFPLFGERTGRRNRSACCYPRPVRPSAVPSPGGGR